MKKIFVFKVFTSIILTTVMLVISTHLSITYAQTNNKTSKFKNSLSEATGEAGRGYDTEFDENNVVQDTTSNSEVVIFTNYILSTDSVTLESNGESVFVDLIGVTKDNQYVNLCRAATWSTDDQDIAVADSGRILGQGKGNTIITVSYGDYTSKIYVKVKSHLDIGKEVDKINKKDFDSSTYSLFSLKNSTRRFVFFTKNLFHGSSNFTSLSLTTSERNTIISNAQAMLNVFWIPAKNIRGWRNGYTFYVGNKYAGIPYSQTVYQCDLAKFNSYYNSTTSGFCDNYTRSLWNDDLNAYETIIMPKYGNDCSGYVSFCWSISRNTTSSLVDGIKNGTFPKVGSYNAYNPTTTELKTAYKSLQKGDAVVKSGHTFLIASNDTANSKVYCYEQTPYFVQYTVWTYNTMASNKYMPFAKK